MKWEQIKQKDDRSVIIPWNWIFPYYYEALNVLFRIENALRVFTYIVLKNEFKEKWLDINLESDDLAQSSIGKIGKLRIKQTMRYGYLSYYIPCPLMYITSGELIRLIFSDSYWHLFNNYFPGSKEIIRNKLNEINTVRNALAHFRPIKQSDVELIKQNASNILPKIEKFIIDLIQCSNIVPTNSEEDWYNELKSLDTDYCSFSFNQSNDEKWVKVSLKYSCSVLGKETRFLRNYRILNLNTPNILLSFPEIRRRLIFLAEDLYEPSIDGNVATFSKSIIMLFSHYVISHEHDIIKRELGSLISKISEETYMIQNNNFAKGTLVESINAHMEYRISQSGFGYWQDRTKNYYKLATENDPPEYWGLLFPIDQDFITDTHEYPWMNIDISELPI